jgi:N-acetylneuraminic acid mutarotase
VQRFLPLAIALSLLVPGTASASARVAPSGGWQIRAPLPLDLYGGTAASNGTYAYVAGGYSFSTSQTLDTLFRFDPASNTWTTLASMPTAAIMASAVYYPPTNKIYVFGGEDAVSGTNYSITRRS